MFILDKIFIQSFLYLQRFNVYPQKEANQERLKIKIYYQTLAKMDKTAKIYENIIQQMIINLLIR
ncbi:hypothetical protein TTHERM_000122449 (macronuclear) [Tetrahymena thermophila SB210]|uniref:Uncharacterized protein n=1 Tax=Tetrahymena thermophila (strain SB210) TaxID=312017 RepID=W7XJQ4_TETTS|nr:hypothetical protein TTHERM_000122449 [Tetrahymena thermophila SB210]EWS75801.1 hypothetical protein TTHERM_000122449 [Tetrahymena thermophila SB210]|eukprot:XP_012651723.1 hypothetical protein TTHERM_000122449 [Tetrahymena thermophila SB210]